MSKRYNDAVWNVAGVRSLEAKIEAQLQRGGIVGCSKPMIWAAKHGNLPAIRAILQSGVDVNMDVRYYELDRFALWLQNTTKWMRLSCCSKLELTRTYETRGRDTALLARKRA